MADIGNMPLSWWVYPPHWWRGRTRERLYCWLHAPEAGRPARVIDERGQIWEADASLPLYPQLAAYAQQRDGNRAGGRTIYFNASQHDMRWWAQLVLEASRDKKAELSFTKKTGFRGIRWPHAGRRRGSALLMDGAWGRSDHAPSPADFIGALRRTMDCFGVGDYDSAGSLGEATLAKFWTEGGFRRLWRLPPRIVGWLSAYMIGGRAFGPIAETEYPVTRHLDLSSAHATAVKRGLPAGEGVWYGMRPANRDLVLFGLWEVEVLRDAPSTPVPYRERWGDRPSRLIWHLDAGTTFRYAGWAEEMDLLEEMGVARVSWCGGLGWERLDTFVTPWMDRITNQRSIAEEMGDDLVAGFCKQVANATVGMWSLHDPEYQVVTYHEAGPEDAPIEFMNYFRGPDLGPSGLFLKTISSQPKVAHPVHWASYVRMAVRLEQWHQEQREMASGNRVVAGNFDSLTIVGDRPIAQATNDERVAAVQEAHPWMWRETEHGVTIVLDARSELYPGEGAGKTPGRRLDAAHMAALVESIRARAGSGGEWIR